jgi:hypothetical protein
MQLSWAHWRNFQSVQHYHQLCLNHCVSCWVFSSPSFCENQLPKRQGKSYSNPLKLKRAHDLLYVMNENVRLVKRWYVFSRSWAALWKNKPIIHSTALSSMYLGHAQYFSHGSLLELVHPECCTYSIIFGIKLKALCMTNSCPTIELQPQTIISESFKTTHSSQKHYMCKYTLQGEATQGRDRAREGNKKLEVVDVFTVQEWM